MKNSKLRSLFLLWLGAAISIAEIVTGTLIAPLGWEQGLLAILIGHLIGCFIFLLPAGYISAQQNQTAINVTKMAFGKIGVTIFSLLNALQLLGWTAVMIVNAQLAMNTISQSLFNYHSIFVMSAIVAIFIIVWLLLKSDWLLKINNWVILILILGMLLFVGNLILQNHSKFYVQSATLSFGQAVELNITMALSWLPVIGDYTQKTFHPLKVSVFSVLGYFIGSIAMFILGLAIVLLTQQSDLNSALVNSNLGVGTLLIIIFSTVTTTFMDAYSAAVSWSNVFHSKHINFIAIIVTLLGLGIAVFISMKYYKNFLSAIGAVFTPLFAILFVSVFFIKKRLNLKLNFFWWILGVLVYPELQKIDFWGGTTSLLLILLSIGVYLSSLITKTYPLIDFKEDDQ